MPYSNVTAFQRYQAKIEAVRGVAETVMTRWLYLDAGSGFNWTYAREREDAPETLRSFHVDRDTALTSEGVTFLGSELLSLVEEVLPARFGGQVGDYQLAEEEIDGQVRVCILVAPDVGAVDEDEVIATVLDALGSDSYGHRRRFE